MSEKQLFDELIKEGIISKEQAGKILKSAELSGKSAEEIVYEDKIADENKVAAIKSKLLNIHFKTVEAQKIPQEALDIVPYKTSRTYKLIPI